MMVVTLQKRPSKVTYQILAAIVANINVIGNGCTIGWTSPSTPILRSDSSPLPSGPLTFEEAAWVGCLPSLSAILGTLVFGILSKYIGRKGSMMWCAVLSIMSWMGIYFATLPWHLLVARFLTGLQGGGTLLCISMYIVEIASEHVRGRLCSLIMVSLNIGVLVGYVAGSTLAYETVLKVMVLIPILYAILFFWFPETPMYLLAKDRIDEAEKSLRFYRNCPKELNDSEIIEEMQKLITINQHSSQNSIKLADFQSANAIRGMLIGPILIALCQFSGNVSISSYAATIFMETGSTLNPNASSIIMGSFQVIGTIIASFLIDRLGRRCLLLTSLAGTAFTLNVTGLYCYFHSCGYDVSSWSMLPVISLSAFVIISSVGVAPVPLVVVSEVLPQKIRRVGVTFCVCCLCTFAFMILLIFPAMLDYFGLHNCMWIFALVNCFGFVFTWFVVPETNGINLNQLENVKGMEMRELT